MSFKSFSEIYLSHRSGKGSVRWERSFEKKLMEQNLKESTVHKTGYRLEKSSLARYFKIDHEKLYVTVELIRYKF